MRARQSRANRALLDDRLSSTFMKIEPRSMKGFPAHPWLSPAQWQWNLDQSFFLQIFPLNDIKGGGISHFIHSRFDIKPLQALYTQIPAQINTIAGLLPHTLQGLKHIYSLSSPSMMNAGNMICFTTATQLLLVFFITTAQGENWRKRSCAAEPCLNGGYCIDKGVRGHLCNCPAEFTGHSCESATIPPVNCAHLPHGDHADPLKCPSEIFYKCGGGGWLMRCDIGTFYNAQSNSCLFRDQVKCGASPPPPLPPRNPCDSSPCLNNGQCMRNPFRLGDFNCHCLSGFSGLRCQTRTNPPPPPTPHWQRWVAQKGTKRNCASKPCLNGGRCFDMIHSEKGFLCHCPAPFIGHSCETRAWPNKCRFQHQVQFNLSIYVCPPPHSYHELCFYLFPIHLCIMKFLILKVRKQ